MNIIEPAQIEKSAAIESILLQGLEQPKSFWEQLLDINRAFGFRYAFWDTAQAVIMALLSIGLCLLVVLSGQVRYAYSTLFAVSPMLFIFIFLFTETIERLSGLYELKMTCKYTIQQLMAFRIVCLSLAGMLVCVVISLLIGWPDSLHSFIKALSISLSALFLFSFASVFILRLSANKWVGVCAMGIWVAFLVLPIGVIGLDRWELLLAGVPIGITASTAVIGLLLLMNEVNILVKFKKREVAYCVGG